MKTMFLTALLVMGTTGLAMAASSGWLVATGDVGAWDDFNVSPASYVDKYRAVDEAVCNDNTDGVWVPAHRVNDKQAFSVDISSVPVGTVITGVTVRPCMSANTSGFGSSTVGLRINLDGLSSYYQMYTLVGDTPIVQTDAVFASTTITKATTTELIVGFKYFGGVGARISHFMTELQF